MSLDGPRLPCLNVSGAAISHLDPVWVCGVEESKRGDTDSRYVVHVTNESAAVYGPVSSAGLWPFPRLAGIAAQNIAADKKGTCILEATPLIARVYNPRGSQQIDLTDRLSAQVLAPLVTNPATGRIETWFRNLLDTPVLDMEGVGADSPFIGNSLYLDSSVQRTSALWHNLGKVRSAESVDFDLCAVARMPFPMLRGKTVATSQIHSSVGVQLISAIADGWSESGIESDTVRLPFRLTNVRNDFATVQADRFVQLAHADGFWYLTAAEC